MKKIINVLVVEDNKYFNNLLMEELKQCTQSERIKNNFKFIFHPFTKAGDLTTRIKSHDFKNEYSIAFIDYYLGDGINGSHIIKMLKEKTSDTAIILLSHSWNVKEKVRPGMYDFFVYKDNSAAALCRLCLEQYLDNNFFIPLA